MNAARRKPRIFSDHKPPLVAFVLVAVTSLLLLVHGARSDAAPGWLRQGVSTVVAGGAPLAQHVVSGTLLEPPPAVPHTESAAEAPTVAVEPPAVAQPQAPASSAPADEPVHHGQEHPVAASPTGPALTPPTPTVSTSPEPSETPSATPPGHGARGDGVVYGPPGLSAEHGPEQPVRGDGDFEDGQHPWWGHEHRHHGHGHHRGD